MGVEWSTPIYSLNMQLGCLMKTLGFPAPTHVGCGGSPAGQLLGRQAFAKTSEIVRNDIFTKHKTCH